MSEPPTSRAELGRNLAALLFSALVVITCSASRTEREPPAVAPAASQAPAVPLASAGPSASAAPVASASASAAVPRLTSKLDLPHFNATLADLAAGQRSDHVRVVWLGDSHTVADLWTGEVRRTLQKAFGNGGPGFAHLGWATKYRHDGLKFEVSAKWNQEPAAYSRSDRFDDGVFGLGGVRFAPAEEGARASAELTDLPAKQKLRWDVSYRLLDEQAVLLVDPQGGVTVKATKTNEAGPGDIRHQTLQTEGVGRVEVVSRGKVELLGLVVERKEPGVVLDTVGLNGARLSTFLAWDEASWVAELARRKPDLVVVTFGSNESSDAHPEAERYERQLTQLLGRVRTAEPRSDCLVITPIDRAGAPYAGRLAVINEGLQRAATQARCAIWSAQQAMGGPGSAESWAAENPPRAAADGVHLTPKGYQSLAEALGRDLVPR